MSPTSIVLSWLHGNSAALAIATYSVVGLHEVGHVVAGRIVGVATQEICLGLWPRVDVGAIAGCRIVVGILPAGEVVFGPRPAAFPWWKKAIRDAGGAAASLILCLVAAGASRVFPAGGFLEITAYVALADFLCHVSPLTSDGRDILRHLRAAIAARATT